MAAKVRPDADADQTGGGERLPQRPVLEGEEQGAQAAHHGTQRDHGA